MIKPTLVVGFSEKTGRYSFIAYRLLKIHGHPVYLMNNRGGLYEGIKISKSFPKNLNPGDIHTITLYMNPQNQESYLEKFIKLKPARIIFNPGTENPKLEDLCRQNGIEPVVGCTLVLLKTGQF